MSAKKLSFVAYPSADKQLANLIEEAIYKANSFPLPVRYEPWIFNDISGVPLVTPIVSGIEDSSFIVADITYLNLNVIFEIGFAIGKERRVFLIRNSQIAGDINVAKEAGIFDTLGYFEYSDATSLKDRLTSNIELAPLSFNHAIDHKAPIYMVEPSLRNSSTQILTSRIKKAGYRYRSFNPSEDVRLSAIDAVRQVATSSGIVMLLQDEDTQGSKEHNVRVMFVAGLAMGMGKPLLILTPVNYLAPLDVRDIAKIFREPKDIIEHVSDFCPQINNYSQQVDPPPIDTGGILASLSLGDPTAENEMTTLSHYYLRTDQYQRALRGEVNLIVGRKGSGKTALFIQVRDKKRSDKRNIVVDLKPEGYQLLKLKEEILEFLSEGSRQHLVTGFWEYLILLEVAHKLLEKDQHTYKYNHEIRELYLDLKNTYKTDEFSVEGDFSERLSAISFRLSEQYKKRHPDSVSSSISSEEVSKILYAHDIRNLKEKISKYLEQKESVWVLFDNLDKGWSTKGVDVIDATVLRCLIDAGRKIEREMARSSHAFHCIIFIRNDVFEHLMNQSADYGKEMRSTLDWTDVDLLKEMLRLRLISSLDSKACEMDFAALWRTVCISQVNGIDSSDYLISRSLMRPRNLLKIFNHIRGFAVNFNHAKIEVDDIEKGLKAYSQDLIIELDRELGDVHADARDTLYYLIDSPSELTKERLIKLIEDAGLSNEQVSEVVNFLLYYGVLGIRVTDGDYFIYDTNYDLKPLNIRSSRANGDFTYIINPAFWPALNVREVSKGEGVH